MNRAFGCLCALLLLTACASAAPASDAISTPAPESTTQAAEESAPPTATTAPAASLVPYPPPPSETPTPLPYPWPTPRPPTLAPTATLTPFLSRTPAPAPTTGPSGFNPPPLPAAGFAEEQLVLVTENGSLIIYWTGDSHISSLLGPGEYNIGDDDYLVPLAWPMRFCGSGHYIIVPRPAGDTWVVPMDSVPGPIHDARLSATCSPISPQFVFTAGRGQFPDAQDGNVYVQDYFPAAETKLLTELPGMAIWPIWSPGCMEGQTAGDCGQSVAVSAKDERGSVVWLVDVETGQRRELGRFRPPPIGGTLWHRWAADGTGVIVRADRDQLFFPLEDGGPRPLVVEQRVAPVGSSLSPDGTMYAHVVRDAEGSTALVVGLMESGEEIVSEQRFDQLERVSWTGNGNYVLMTNYAPPGYELWAIIPRTWPQLQMDDPILVAEHVTYLGTMPELISRATEVDTRPWASVGAPIPAGSPETWRTHTAPEAGLTFAAPPGWRVWINDTSFIVANYDALTDGMVALTDEQIRIDGRWSGDFGNSLDYTNLPAMQDMHYDWVVEPIEAGGAMGVVLRDVISPVCEHVLLPHGRGELEISYCPATDQRRDFMLDFLARLELAPAEVAP